MRNLWNIVEKRNPFSIHGIFSSRESAENWLMLDCPRYVEMGFFIDKSLTVEDFVIVDPKPAKCIA